MGLAYAYAVAGTNAEKVRGRLLKPLVMFDALRPTLTDWEMVKSKMIAAKSRCNYAYDLSQPTKMKEQ
jgi:hypothetical protein